MNKLSSEPSEFPVKGRTKGMDGDDLEGEKKIGEGTGKTKAPTPNLDQNDDPEWVEKTISGDQDAFEHLFHKYRQRLFGVVWKILREENSALDVVQEAFVRAYQRIEDLRGDALFFPWLRRIAVNLAIDRLRHSGRGVEVGFEEAQFGEGGGADVERLGRDPRERAERESPARKAELSEFARDLQVALQKLSPAHRTVFLLHASEGMSYKEIAEAMKCNLGTVMSRLFYARKKLQELLASHLEGEG